MEMCRVSGRSSLIGQGFALCLYVVVVSDRNPELTVPLGTMVVVLMGLYLPGPDER